jgi:hypothetical protein
MTDEYWTELGRRAVACKAWRWMDGTLTMDDARVAFGVFVEDVEVVEQDRAAGSDSGLLLRRGVADFDTPDFRDPATVGSLWGLLEWMGYRVSMGYRLNSTDPMVCLQREGQETIYFSGESVAEALVSALESAK